MFFFAFFLCTGPIFSFFEAVYQCATKTSSYGHTTVKAPHPIRTAKLSTVGPDQYFGRGLQGNLGCCMASSFYFLLFCHRPSLANALCRKGRLFWKNRLFCILGPVGPCTGFPRPPPVRAATILMKQKRSESFEYFRFSTVLLHKINQFTTDRLLLILFYSFKIES